MRKQKFKTFRCGHCGGKVDLHDGFFDSSHKRRYAIRPGIETQVVDVVLPKNLMVPTCEGCGEFWTTPDFEEIMEAAAQMEWMRANNFTS